MSAQIITTTSFHLLSPNPPIRKQKVGIMSRISRVLFPESSSLSRASSPTRDRVSGVDSLAGMTHDINQLGAHANQEKENDDMNRSKRRSRRNKPQSRVHINSSQSLGNSLINIGQCQVLEKKKEMNSNKSRTTRTSPFSKMSTNPFGVFSILGNLNPQSNRKKKRNCVSFVVETKIDSKSKRDERQRKRVASREKNNDGKNQEKSFKRNQKRSSNSEVAYENDSSGVIFESDDANVVVSPMSMSRTKRMDDKQHTPMQTDEPYQFTKRKSKQEVDRTILSPSIAPKPLKRIDTRATPDLKASQSSQILFTETSHDFDEIHAEAQAILRAAEQARSIVSVTDISDLSPDEISTVSRIQAKAIVAANPEISLPNKSKSTKPSLEQINHQIDLQTKALIHAYTTALRSTPRMDAHERFEELQNCKVTNTLETNAVVSPSRLTNTGFDMIIEQKNKNDTIEFNNTEKDHVSEESRDETEYVDVAPMTEGSKPNEEFPDVPDSHIKEENQYNIKVAAMVESSKPDQETPDVPDLVAKEKDEDDHVSDSDNQIDAVPIAVDIEIAQSPSSLNNVTNQNEILHLNDFSDDALQEVKDTVTATNDTETNQSEPNRELDPLQKHAAINIVDSVPKEDSKFTDEYKSYIGRRVAGYFPRFKKYYRGTVVKFYKNDEEVIFRIKYDDGDEEFINYDDENAIEGRDLKRLLENFEKYGEESISKSKHKKKQRNAKLAETKKSKDDECHDKNANLSKRPKRHVRQVDRLELTFRRKKKKQTDKAVSAEVSNIQKDENGDNIHHQMTDQNSCIRSTTSQQIQKEKQSTSEEDAHSIENGNVRETISDDSTSNIEPNAYLKLREERIARNQEKLKQLGLSASTEKKPKKKSNKSTHEASQTKFEEKENVPRRSVRNKKPTTPSFEDDDGEIRVEEIFDEELNKDGWSPKTISLLKKAYTTTDPLAANFWGKVAETVGGRTGEECRDKWFSLSTVHDTKRPKESKNLNCFMNGDQDEDDIFNSTPYRENRMKTRLNSPSQSRKPLSRLSDIFSSPIFNRLNAKTNNEGSVDDEAETPRRFRLQYKSYMKEIKAGAIGKVKWPKGKKKVSQMLPKSRLCASAESGEIQVKGLVSPGGTFKLDEPDIDEIEDAYLYENELDNASDDCSVY